jgi:NAD(P)-dependent dehydrogenase (short-subunit alcohol dehydrogenase family)
VLGGDAASYDRKAAYGKSKLANLLFTYELSRRLAGTTTTANAVHPGGVATNLGRNNGTISWLRHYVYYILKRQLITPSKAAEAIAYLALSDDVRGITGKYFYNQRQIESSAASRDPEAQKKLWDLSLRLCGSEA